MAFLAILVSEDSSYLNYEDFQMKSHAASRWGRAVRDASLGTGLVTWRSRTAGQSESPREGAGWFWHATVELQSILGRSGYLER